MAYNEDKKSCWYTRSNKLRISWVTETFRLIEHTKWVRRRAEVRRLSLLHRCRHASLLWPSKTDLSFMRNAKRERRGVCRRDRVKSSTFLQSHTSHHVHWVWDLNCRMETSFSCGATFDGDFIYFLCWLIAADRLLRLTALFDGKAEEIHLNFHYRKLHHLAEWIIEHNMMYFYFTAQVIFWIQRKKGKVARENMQQQKSV